MNFDGGYTEEVSSDHDVSNLGKKRKFLDVTNDHLNSYASKYICYEVLVEHDPFSKESLQAKVFYTHTYEDIEQSKDESEFGNAAFYLNSTGMDSRTSEELSMSYQNTEFYRNEKCDDLIDEELEVLLYSNGIVPTSYLRLPERLKAEKESQVSARKPTVDHEFEQYFSMLML